MAFGADSWPLPRSSRRGWPRSPATRRRRPSRRRRRLCSRSRTRPTLRARAPPLSCPSGRFKASRSASRALAHRLVDFAAGLTAVASPDRRSTDEERNRMTKIKDELVTKLAERCQKADRGLKTRILDEFVEPASCHRKAQLSFLPMALKLRSGVVQQRLPAQRFQPSRLSLWSLIRLWERYRQRMLHFLLASPMTWQAGIATFSLTTFAGIFYNVGGGFLLWMTTPLALEADTRIGATLKLRGASRLKGVVGAQARARRP